MGSMNRFFLTEEEIIALGLPVQTGNKRIRDNRRYYLNAHKKQELEEFRNGKRGILKKDKKEIIKNKDSEEYKYEGTLSIQDLETAIEFFNIDLDKWEVDQVRYNSWDVTNGKGIKYTNYQVKLNVKKREVLQVKPPKVEPFLFNKGLEKAYMWIIIGCIHRPFHNQKLWDAILQMLHEKKKEIQGIIINGDYLDLRSLSTHDEFIPEGLDLGIEYSDGLKGMMEIKQALGKQYNRIEKVFHFGNHEDRFYRCINDLRKYGNTLQTPEQALQLHENNWEIQTDWKEGYTTLGNNIDVFHGIYYGTNPSKAHLDKCPARNMVFNHSHRFSSYSNGKATAYNIGWLGDVKSEGFKYAHRFTRSEWQPGFAVVYLDGNGEGIVQPIKCSESGFFFGGKKY